MFIRASKLRRFCVLIARLLPPAGALISLISAAVILLLFFSELSAYLTVRVSEHIVVDTRTNQKLQINFNLTLHALRCSGTVRVPARRRLLGCCFVSVCQPQFSLFRTTVALLVSSQKRQLM